MSFSQGLSGLSAASQALDVVGNNIANSRTVGFKSASVAFADVFAGTKTGMGVQVSDIKQNFSDGVLEKGNSELDMGIQGKGFFRLTNEAGKIFYSRNGQFKTDENNFIINSQGMYLTGYQATGMPPTVTPGGEINRIQIPTEQMNARTSDSGVMNGNLDSGTGNISQNALPFAPEDSNTYHSVSPVDAFDSLGNRHTINVYYVKRADNQWDVYSRDITSPVAPVNPPVAVEPVRLEFNNAGRLMTTPALLPVASSAYHGAAPLNFTLNLAGMTQQASDTVMNSPSTNGYAPGSMNGFTLGEKGEVIASYSNGQQQIVAQISLSDFTNPGGLSSQGNNCWSETTSSGQPMNGLSGIGTLGNLYGNRLETSNVDQGNEMVNMIVFQRNYQFNSQTIRTQSELLQTLLNIG
jgi:flagellar hook protein FlgE